MFDDTAQGGMDNLGANEESLRMVSANAIGNEPVSDESCARTSSTASSGNPGSRRSSSCSSMPPANAKCHRTISCSPGLPDWARPPSR